MNYNDYDFSDVKHIILKVVGEYFSMTNGWIHDKTRRREYVIPRQWCHYFGVQFKNGTYVAVGREYGGKDHATVIHSKEVIESDLYKLPSGKAVSPVAEKNLINLEKRLNGQLKRLGSNETRKSRCRYRKLRYRGKFRKSRMLIKQFA